MAQQPYDIPIAVSAEQGMVLLDGPDGIALSMTPEAARTSADRIRAAADEALDQQRRADRD